MCERNDAEGQVGSADFVDVGPLKSLPSGTTQPVAVGADRFTLVNLHGRVLAVGDLCLCCSQSLSTATVADGLLTCSGCGWKYDLQHGCVDGLPNLRIEMHDVGVSEGRLLLPSAIAAPASDP